jgi:hypothetical protein
MYRFRQFIGRNGMPDEPIVDAVPRTARYGYRDPRITLPPAVALRVLGDVLADADATALLGIVRGCADLRGRRFVFDVSLEAGRMNPRQLATASLHESDIISRTRCAEALAARAIARNQPELMEEFLAGTSARVRVTALTTLVRLGHPQPGLRFLDDDASMVRLTTQRTLRRLDAKADVVALLQDPAPVVVRNVVGLLRASSSKAPVERLWVLLGDADRPRQVRDAARLLLADRNAWTRIKADLLLSR